MRISTKTKVRTGRILRKARLLLGLSLSFFTFTIPAGAGPFSQIVVFGDSLSDNGNLFASHGIPPSPPYFEGRFSNGPVWVEHLSDCLGLEPDNVRNLATGGATTGTSNTTVPDGPGLLTQIAAFAGSESSADPKTLYVVWAGANDLLADVTDPEITIRAAVTNIATAVAGLAELGAQTILVANLPDLGRVPFVLAGGDPDSIGGATLLSVAFNNALASTLDDLESALEIDFVRLDVFSVLAEIVADPKAFGFANVADRCLSADLTATCDSPNQYLFWDSVHPSAAAHAVLAEIACAALPAVHFYRGDPDSSGSSDIGDAIGILNFLFAGTNEPLCMESADVNDDGSVDLGDATNLINWLFLGGPPPVAPGPPGQAEACGPDHPDSPVDLGCRTYTKC